MTYFHIKVSIEQEIERIRKGEGTVLKCNNTKARNILHEAKREGMIYRSGCDNISSIGNCLGHEKQ